MSSIKRLEKEYVKRDQDNKVQHERLVGSVPISSSALGVINTVISMDPSGLAGAEWTSMANLYDDFRVKGIRVRLSSKQQYSVTAQTDMVVICYDNQNLTALTSLNDGLQYSTSKVFNAVWTHSTTGENRDSCLTFSWARPTAGKNTAISWTPTSSPGSDLGAVKFYSVNLTASTTYMVAAVEYFIEFRGRN